MRKLKVLLVDDNEAIRFGFAQYLEREQISVHEAGSLASARDLVSKQQFDALILDLDLPDGDGMDLLADIKASNPDLPILIVTGSARKTAVECMSLGADSYLCKPISMQQLHSSLMQLLKK